MISYLKGEILALDPTKLTLMCGAVGYEIHISLNTFSQVKDLHEIGLYCHLVVREDVLQLFGFHDIEEKESFKMLIAVSGIGPNTARNVLSHISPIELNQAILGAEVHTIQKIKGIGAKTAQRLVLELKDKVVGLVASEGHEEIVKKGNNLKEEALLALTSLGIGRKQAGEKIEKVLRIQGDLSVEDLIKAVLKQS